MFKVFDSFSYGPELLYVGCGRGWYRGYFTFAMVSW